MSLKISLRTPEGCSLSRATSFNRHNVKMFFENLENVMSRHEVFGNGSRVYNLDETSTMTVQKSAKVLAIKGQKQVSKVTSAERGTLVTTCYIVNALGNTLPPVMIFPRVHFKQHMINDAPAGSLGLATPSGWMNGELFVQTMQHFINYTNSSKDNPTLLILDNHESHICIEALNLAKVHGVTVLTVPPHSTGKMQPLDTGVFGPFKIAYNKAADSWMMRNPGKTISIYEVAGLVKEAHMKAMTPNNICNGFQGTGIFPFNNDIFNDDDFAPSEVTDRQLEKENEIPPENHADKDRTRTPSPSILLTSGEVSSLMEPPTESHCPPSEGLVLPISKDISIEFLLSETVPAKMISTDLPRISPLILNKPSLISQLATPAHFSSTDLLNMDPPHTPPKQIIQKPDNAPSTSTNRFQQVKKFISPFEFRGLPKAGPRQSGRKPRRKGKSMIATDTPIKNEIEQRAEEKNNRKNKKKVVKRKVLESDSGSEEEERMSIYSEDESMLDDEDEIIAVDPDNFHPLQSFPEEGNFILVEFNVRQKKIYFIGRVIGKNSEIEVEVSFLRKSIKNPNKFHLPNVPDIAAVALHDVKMILPPPAFSGSTQRTQGLYNFDIDFTTIDLR